MAEQHPLTRGQRAMWLLYEMNPDGGAYNCTYAWHVRSALDVAAFSRALHTLAERHGTLRATYEAEDGEVWQRVHEAPLPHFEEVAAEAWNSREVMAELDREVYRPFALHREPPVRWRLYQRPEGDSILVLGMHHIACDGWSIMTLLNELRDLYAAETAGGLLGDTVLTLPEIKRTNEDFVALEEEMLAGEQGALHLAYWQERLAGELTDLDLRTDFSRPRLPGVKGDLLRLGLDQGLTDRLCALAKNLGVSPFKFFLTAYQIFLHRYTGQDDFCVGVATAGRTQEFAGIFNDFVNPVAIRTQVAGNPTFQDFLQAQAPRISEDLRHRDYPFTELVRRILKDRDASRTPIFQTQFVWENFNLFENTERPMLSMEEDLVERWNLGELALERIFVTGTLDPFDLNMKFVQVGKSFFLQLEYNTELFRQESMRRLAANFNRLLESIARRRQQSGPQEAPGPRAAPGAAGECG